MIEEKVFKDPIHKYVYVQDKLIWELINTKEFQRLRRIKQLGTSYFTYHGAEHSRFPHSLGVYEITRQVILQFERNSYKGFTKEESFLIMVSALLHDLGHGPFSHTSERIFEFNHEDWTKKIILGDTEVNNLLRGYDNDLPEKIVSIINKTYHNSIVVNLISSQLDADRMDYLLRDAYHTGVNYGTFDLERLLRVLRPFNNMLVIKESGMHTVEDYLMSRYQMYWQVYFHPVTRSGEILLKKIFLRAKYLYESQYQFSFFIEQIIKLFDKNINIGEFLQFDDYLFTTLVNLWTKEKDPILSDLASRFLNRKLFKYIEFEVNNFEKIKKISDLFNSNGIESDYYLEIDSQSDLPYDIYHPEGASKIIPIYLLTPLDKILEISTQSDIIKSIVGKTRTVNRIFFPMEVLIERSLIGEFKKILKENLC
ncbi:MAG: HD domain-containing protein [Vulcanibacillus sp.]